MFITIRKWTKVSMVPCEAEGADTEERFSSFSGGETVISAGVIDSMVRVEEGLSESLIF